VCEVWIAVARIHETQRLVVRGIAGLPHVAGLNPNLEGRAGQPGGAVADDWLQGRLAKRIRWSSRGEERLGTDCLVYIEVCPYHVHRDGVAVHRIGH
jgi:hypothetical protein